MKRSITLTLASALALSLAAVAPAFPQSDLEGPDQRVAYADLNLNNRAGQEAMLQRLEYAAGRACGERVGTIPLYFRIEIERCVDQKMSQAVADVGHGGLSALYYGRNPEIIVASR
jgi:UrcA family protein